MYDLPMVEQKIRINPFYSDSAPLVCLLDMHGHTDGLIK